MEELIYEVEENPYVHARQCSFACFHIHHRLVDETGHYKDDKLMVWPPYSPDLNPIENLWSIIKQEVYICGKQYNSKDELWNGVKDAASYISRNVIRNLTSSVDQRVLSAVQKNGGYIKHWNKFNE